MKTCQRKLCLPSLASLAGVNVPQGQAPDSKNNMHVLLNKSQQPREFLVEQSLNSTLSLLVGDWKYIEPSKGPRINKDINTELGNLPEPQLYNLAEDPGETKNLVKANAEKLEEMRSMLEKIKQNK